MTEITEKYRIGDRVNFKGSGDLHNKYGTVIAYKWQGVMVVFDDCGSTYAIYIKSPELLELVVNT